MNHITKEDLVYLYGIIDRDFASMEEQDRADQIIDRIATIFFGKTIREIESEPKDNEAAMEVLKNHKCKCWFIDSKLWDECHYHACMRSGKNANGDPLSWINGGKDIRAK